MRHSLPKPDHFFFGAPPRLLFGCYHPPYQDRGCDNGVLLCYPFGYEYIRAHRVFHQIAIKLAINGFHVFRFDYLGTGDSSGDMELVRLNHWLEDISIASDQLKQRSKLSRMSLIGLRLGATLAIMAAKDMAGVDALVLWEPVLNGSTFLRELADEQYKFEESIPEYRNKFRRDRQERIPDEIIGFPMPRALFDDLRQVDLTTISILANDIHVVLSNESSEMKSLFDLLNNGERNVTKDVIDDPKLWLEEPYKALVPARTLNAIVTRVIGKIG